MFPRKLGITKGFIGSLMNPFFISSKGIHMRTGKLKQFLCQTGWNLIYTVPKGEHGTLSIHLVSDTNEAVEHQVRHVVQGNSDATEPTAIHSITPPFTITDEVYTIKELGVGSLDDVWVYASLTDVLVASINTQGIEYTHGPSQGDNRL